MKFVNRDPNQPVRIKLTQVLGSPDIYTMNNISTVAISGEEGTPLSAENINNLTVKATNIEGIVPLSNLPISSLPAIPGEKGETGERGPAGPQGVGVNVVNGYLCDTQAKFETLIASPNWLSFETVYFDGIYVGNAGFTVSTMNNSGIKIPQSVKRIMGFNSAKINLTNCLITGYYEKGALYYQQLPLTDDYCIENIEVMCVAVTTSPSSPSAFAHCRNLKNCKGSTIGGNYLSCNTFVNCHNLYCCEGVAINEGGGYSGAKGFYNCTNLVFCKGQGSSFANAEAIGFHNCKRLSNCEGIGNGLNGTTTAIGFEFCEQLSNCTGEAKQSASKNAIAFRSCKQLSNCSGVGTSGGTGDGYAFDSCSYATCCVRSGESTTAVWGTYTKRDDNSCDF